MAKNKLNISSRLIRHLSVSANKHNAKTHLKNLQLGKSTSEIALSIKRTGDLLLRSNEWKSLRNAVIAEYGTRCMKCGLIPYKKRNIHIDHIKPRKFFPELALDFNNLQVLCNVCNKVKGNKHYIDYRIKK